MSNPEPRRHGLPWGAVVMATVAVYVVPALYLAARGFAGESAVVTASESAFLRAQQGAGAADSNALAELTARWREFHLLKAAFAGLLVVRLAAHASVSRRRAEQVERGRRRWPSVAAYGATLVWLLGALVVLIANVQGAIAPLASAASLLPRGPGHERLADVLTDLRSTIEVGTPSSAGGIAGDLLTDFVHYHAVLAVLAATAGAVLTTMTLRVVSAWWRLRGSGRASQPTWLVQMGLFGIAASLFLLLAAANTSTWVDPIPALAATLNRG